MTQLKIEKLAYGGEGIAFQEGKICFVEGGLPGEDVEAVFTQNKSNFARARVTQILKPSPQRTVPPCIYVKDCGGCQYQHVAYAEELRWKEIQAREYLARHLKIAESLVKPIQGGGEGYHYRNSITVQKCGSGVGFYGEDNETVIPVENCLLANERLVPIFKEAITAKSAKVTYRLSAEGEIVSDLQDKIFPVKAGEKLLYTHSKSFFQNNLPVTAQIGVQLAQWVKKIAPSEFMDLYAGVGTFTALAANGVKKAVCVEENPQSLKALEMNLEVSGVPHEILKGKVETVFRPYYELYEFEHPFFFLDPPRMGMSERFSEFLSKQKGIPAIAYLSCHLGTLARDLGTILKGGLFKITEVVPFDMFPRTKHIEILVLLCPK